jgi:hypothetical protein
MVDDAANPGNLIPEFEDFRPLISEGGALTLPDPGGQCEMKSYHVSLDPADGTTLIYAGDPDFDCNEVTDD